jgi:hypothetical protein
MKDFFCLKAREHFYIDPQQDANLYFGRHELESRLKEQIENSFLKVGVPKIFMTGPYGSGKTHTLFHLKHFLSQATARPSVEVIYFDIGPMKAKTHYSQLHRSFLDRLSRDRVKQLVDRFVSENVGPNLETALKAFFPTADIANAMRSLSFGATQSLPAWKWLAGEKLSNEQHQVLNLTKNLTEPGELIEVLFSVGKLIRQLEDRKIVYLVDEAEELDHVTNPDAAASFQWALRQLADNDNKNIGFVFAARAVGGEELPLILASEAIKSRIGENNIIDIPHFGGVQDIKGFVLDLLASLIDRQAAEKRMQEMALSTDIQSYPFTDSSLDCFCEYIRENPERALPRTIIECINDCAVGAFRAAEPLIDERRVDGMRR